MGNIFNDKAFKIILKRLINTKEPEFAINQLVEKVSVVRNLIIKDEINGGPYLSSQQIGGSLIAGSTIVYWAGWMLLPLWIPSLAALAGTIGALGLLSGFKWWQEGHRNWIFIKTFYSFLYIIEMADGVITSEESRYLQDFILSLPLSNSQRKELMAIKYEKAEEIDIPNWLEHSHRETILAGCWSLAYCDELTDSEVQMLNKIAERLKINPDKALEIKEIVINEINSIEEILICIGKEIKLLKNKFPHAVPIDNENLYKTLAEINARGNSQEKIKNLINDNSYNTCYKILNENNNKILELILTAVLVYYELYHFMLDTTKHQDLTSKLTLRFKELSNKDAPETFIKILNNCNQLLIQLVSKVD